MVSNLSELLSERYYVVQCSFDKPTDRPRYENNVPFVGLGRWRQLPMSFRPVNYVEQAFRLYRLKRKLGIELTISNLWGADLISVLSAGRDRKIALAHINVVGNPTNRMMVRWLSLVSRVYRQFDKVVSVSVPLCREVTQLYGLHEENSQCIHNFAQFSASRPIKSNSEAGNRVLWCGRLVPEKNPEAAIRIMAEVRKARPDVQLIMLGNGPLAQSVRQVCRECGLPVGMDLDDVTSAVILPGFVDDPASYMGATDLQLLTSIDEGLPMTLIEGLATGLPAVVSDCRSGGVRDALGGAPRGRLGELQTELTSCGVLLPVPADEKTRRLWAEWVLRLLNDKELRDKLAKGSHARAQAFSEDTARSHWFKLVESILAP